MLNIREFIYLDVERMKSILSQIEKGLLLEVTEEKGKEMGFEGGISSGSILETFVNAQGMGKYLISNNETETRTLHDYMYNIIEEELLAENYLIEIPDDNQVNKRVTNWPKEVKDNSFVFIKSKIKIEDYSILSSILENMNDLSVALSVINLVSKSGFYNGEEQWNRTEKNLEETNLLLDKSYIKSMSLILRQFYKDKLILTCMPYKKNSNLTFVANLNRNNLRENIEDIIFKYGSLPLSDWFIFGRVSTILPKEYDSTKITNDPVYKRIKNNWSEINSIINSVENFKNLNTDNQRKWKSLGLNEEDFEILKLKNLELSFENIFNSINQLSYETGVKYPSIVFTPIAIYRK